MIDFGDLIAKMHSGRRLRPESDYLTPNMELTDSETFGIADREVFITAPGEAQLIVKNPHRRHFGVLRLDKAYLNATTRRRDQPSLCDFMISDGDNTLLALAELTHSRPDYIEPPASGISHNEPKRLKARRQLLSSIALTEPHLPEAAGREDCCRMAVFGFRVTQGEGLAGRTLNAFNMRPTLREITYWTEEECGDWQFVSVPYPNPLEPSLMNKR